MQVYNNDANAIIASDARPLTLIPYLCPFYYQKRCCGTWCSLFEIAQAIRNQDGIVTKRINLRCGDGNKIFMVQETP